MRVIVIGCGVMGEVHARAAAAHGAVILACGDCNSKRANVLAKKWKARSSTECLELIESSSADAVIVTTPTASHATYVNAAAKSGKHIFCETPFCRTEAECQQCLRTVQKHGVKLFTPHMGHYLQEFEAIRAQVDAGKIGKVGFIKTYRGGPCLNGADDWYHDYRQSGGIVLDGLIHDFDWLHHQFGPVSRVFCQRTSRSTDPTMEYAMATLTMQSGLIAQVIGSRGHPEQFQLKVELCGSGGMIQFDSAETPLLHVPRKTSDSILPGVPDRPMADDPNPLAWEEFLAWIAGGPDPRCTAEEATQAVRIAEAALKSAQTGKPVSL